MQKYSSVITIERFLVQNFANYRTMAEISTAKNSLPKSPTELEKDGPSFSSLFSLASACATGDIAPLTLTSHLGSRRSFIDPIYCNFCMVLSMLFRLVLVNSLFSLRDIDLTLGLLPPRRHVV